MIWTVVCKHCGDTLQDGGGSDILYGCCSICWAKRKPPTADAILYEPT